MLSKPEAYRNFFSCHSALAPSSYFQRDENTSTQFTLDTKREETVLSRKHMGQVVQADYACLYARWAEHLWTLV